MLYQTVADAAAVGLFCVQVWATYSPVKNSPDDARAKAAEGNPTHSATTGAPSLGGVTAVMYFTVHCAFV